MERLFWPKIVALYPCGCKVVISASGLDYCNFCINCLAKHPVTDCWTGMNLACFSNLEEKQSVSWELSWRNVRMIQQRPCLEPVFVDVNTFHTLQRFFPCCVAAISGRYSPRNVRTCLSVITLELARKQLRGAEVVKVFAELGRSKLPQSWGAGWWLEFGAQAQLNRLTFQSLKREWFLPVLVAWGWVKPGKYGQSFEPWLKVEDIRSRGRIFRNSQVTMTRRCWVQVFEIQYLSESFRLPM